MDGAVVVNAGLGQRLSVTVDDFPIENQFYLKDAKARVLNNIESTQRNVIW